MGLLCFSISGGGTLEGEVPIILPGQGSKHRGTYSQNKTDTSAHALMYEGHMLIYNPYRNLLEWVPMRGMSLSLTSVELRLANDLNNICPYPHSKWELTKAHSPHLVYSRPAGDETDTDSWNEPSDSEEWDKPKHGDWSHCPTLPLEEQGLTWEEVTNEPPQRKVITDQEDSDWDADQDTHTPAESQSRDTSKHSLLRKDTLMEMTEPPAESPHDDALTEASMELGSQDVVQIHTGNDDLD